MTVARNARAGVTSNVSMPATSVSAGGYGEKMGESDPSSSTTTGGKGRPYRERRVSVRQLELCQGLEARLERRGTAVSDGPQLTLHLAATGAGT